MNIKKVKAQYLNNKHYYYHENQFKEPKRSTIALCNFVKNTLTSLVLPYNAIDVGCGGGGNIYHLSKVLTETKWTGLDNAKKFFAIAKQHLPETEKFKFVNGYQSMKTQ